MKEILNFYVIFFAVLIHGIHSNKMNLDVPNMSQAIAFLKNIEGFGSGSVCQNLLKSNIQIRIKHFKSIISTCPGTNYCRLAMNKKGLAYGSINSQLQTVLNLIEVDNEDFLRDSSLLGAKYIQFVLADKYLCINRHLRLYSSTQKSKECLWYTMEEPIRSAYYRNIKLEVNRKINTCEIKPIFSPPNMYEQINHQPTCQTNLHVERAYSTQLNRLRSQCTSLMNSHSFYHARRSQNPQSPYMRSHVIITKKVTTEKNVENNLSFFKKEQTRSQYLSDNSMSNTNQDMYSSQLEFSQLEDAPNLLNTKAAPSKKCLHFRNSHFYKECVLKHYKCFRYKDEPVKLKNCRKVLSDFK